MDCISNHSESASQQNEVTMLGLHSAAFLAPELLLHITAYKAARLHGELHVLAESKGVRCGVLAAAGRVVVHPQKALARIYFIYLH